MKSFWNDAHWSTQLLRKYFLRKCAQFSFYINANLYGLKRLYVTNLQVKINVIYRNLYSFFSVNLLSQFWSWRHSNFVYISRPGKLCNDLYNAWFAPAPVQDFGAHCKGILVMKSIQSML